MTMRLAAGVFKALMMVFRVWETSDVVHVSRRYTTAVIAGLL
jgi:hypothetical protein